MQTGPNSLQLAPGAFLLDRYEIVRRLGSGAAGTVYECRDHFLGSLRVALKLILPNNPNSIRAAQRFDREIRACFRIQSPYVVKFYDLVRIDSMIGYSMEFVEGGSLQHLIQNNTDLPLAWRVGIVYYLCLGLGAIHDAGVIHRDIKPGNVLISYSGFPKLADFGLARLADPEPTQLVNNDSTEPGASPIERISDGKSLLGTPEFMSPESIEGQDSGALGDIYALGVTAYELLTGKPAYKFKNLAELLNLKVHTDPIHPSEMNLSIPKGIGEVVMNLMKRDQTLRYQNAYEAAAALKREMDLARLSPLLSYPTRTTEERQADLNEATGGGHRTYGIRPIIEETVADFKELFGKIGSNYTIEDTAEINPHAIQHGEPPHTRIASIVGKPDLSLFLMIVCWLLFLGFLFYNPSRGQYSQPKSIKSVEIPPDR